jgi:transforming growth factor-beta-induced protein
MKAFAVLCSVALAYAHRPTQNLVQLCESTPNLSILTAALVGADLTDTLSDAHSEFTVFAPTDDAFNALPSGVLDRLMKPENKKDLVDILTYHVLPEQVKSTDLQPFQAVTTVEGKPLHVQEWGGKVKVGASLLSKDLKNVVVADNLATNGVAHIIDGVLIPPATLAKLSGPTQNIVELAESNKDLSILVSAVVAADLADALSVPTPHQTVFAPTNDAFNSLPDGTLDDLMKPENKASLRELLLEHVVQRYLPANNLINPNLSGKTFTTEAKTALVSSFSSSSFRDGKVMVAPLSKDNIASTVTAADNKATNGIVHVIDRVLVPTPKQPTQNLVQLCESTPNLSILTAALVAADLTDTLSDASAKFTVFAPTDDAFNALPAGVLDDLMKPENKKQLVDILTYHVLPEEVKSTDLSAFQAVTTVEGKPLHVTVWGGNVKVGPSLLSTDLKNVVAADNLASNGVAHIVDGVLLPPSALMV